MNRVAIVQFARLNSQRLPQKLLEYVGGEPLIDRGLAYLQRLTTSTGAAAFLAVSPRDLPLIAAAKRFGIPMLPLDERADSAHLWPELISPFVEFLYDRFDVVWDANLCCRPFLRQATGEFIVRQCEATKRPFVGVTRKRGVVWPEHSPTPVIGAGELADTQRNPHYFELGHLAYCWPTWALTLPEAQLAEIVQPLELHLYWFERIDIDTPDDLAQARAIAAAGAVRDDR